MIGVEARLGAADTFMDTTIEECLKKTGNLSIFNLSSQSCMVQKVDCLGEIRRNEAIITIFNSEDYNKTWYDILSTPVQCHEGMPTPSTVTQKFFFD